MPLIHQPPKTQDALGVRQQTVLLEDVLLYSQGVTSQSSRPNVWLHWLGAALAGAGIVVVLWACLTAWGAVVHGHPAYAIALALSALGGLLLGWWSLRKIWRERSPKQAGQQTDAKHIGPWGITWRLLLIVLGVTWVGILAWLRPFAAIEPALSAMQSDATVTVTESATDIALSPQGKKNSTAVFFQPGARVDARAYAAVLRPIAESGHTVIIAKQPLGIGFLALSAFDSARAANPDISRWIVAGHSLGGTVAALQAADTNAETDSPVAGMLFYASYPASDVRSSLQVPVESISGSLDGLATPAKIKESRALLPLDAEFTVIEGASHAQFGDYGPQGGDNEPTISNDEARLQISEASVGFVKSVSK